jgi:hypothetical protein
MTSAGPAPQLQFAVIPFFLPVTHHRYPMTTFLEKAGKKIFEKHLEKYAPADPLYEFYTNDKGKQKRRKVCNGST